MAFKEKGRAGEHARLAPSGVHATGTSSREAASAPDSKFTGLSESVEIKVEFNCPVCDTPRAAYEWKPDDDGRARWLIGCANAGCIGSQRKRGGDYLRALRDYSGAPSAAAVLDQPSEWLDLYEIYTAPVEPPPAPTSEQVTRCRKRLHTRSPARSEVLTQWGVSWDTLRSVPLGYGPTYDRVRQGWLGPDALLFFLYREGEYVGHKVRPLRGKTRHPKGLVADMCPLWPPVQRERGWTWLVEGERDALLLRTHGMPATSVTVGKSYWNPRWADELAGLQVLVMFDVGAEASAEKAAHTLNRSERKIRAGYVSARRLGLSRHNEDIADHLAYHHNDPKHLRRIADRWVK